MPFVSNGGKNPIPVSLGASTYQPVGNVNFGAVGGNVATQTIGSTLYDYSPFFVAQTLFRRHSQVPTFKLTLDMIGGARGVSAPTTGHYERDWAMNSVQLIRTSANSGTAGGLVTATVHANSLYTSGALVSGASASGTHIRVGDIILITDTGRQARVQAKVVSGATITLTLKPVGAYTLNADLEMGLQNAAGGKIYAIITNASGEGTGLPEGILPRLYKYENSFQIIKERASVTGSEATNDTYFKTQPLADGGIFVILNEDMVMNFEQKVSNALLFGEVGTGHTDQNVPGIGFDVSVGFTEGLYKFVENSGHTVTYTAGSYTLANIDALGKIIENERAGTREYLTFDGYDMFTLNENTLQGQLAGNPADFLVKRAKMMGVQQEEWQPFTDSNFGYNVGFNMVHKGGVSYYFHNTNEFTSPTGGGAGTSSRYPGVRIACPVGVTKDFKSGGDKAYMGFEWKEMGAYKRKAVVGKFGGVGASPFLGEAASNEYDVATCGIVGEYAFHGACPNKFILQYAA